MAKDWEDTFNYLDHLSKLNFEALLIKYAELGVESLRASSPKRTGLMANDWSYEIIRSGNDSYSIEWHNNDIEGGCNVAVLIQYGHGTRGGGYVSGIDFINPAMEPVVAQLADELWKEVTK